MKSYDASQLSASLTGLAEAFDRKPMTQKGLDVWFETLKEFSTHHVLGVLSTWAKHHGKMPAPSEVWKVVNEIGIAEREKEAVQVKAEERKQVDYPITQAGKRAMAEIRQIMKQPKKSPIAHWESVLQTAKRGSIGYQYATEALMTLRHKRRPVRQPGEDIEPTSPVVPQETTEPHSEIGWS